MLFHILIHFRNEDGSIGTRDYMNGDRVSKYKEKISAIHAADWVLQTDESFVKVQVFQEGLSKAIYTNPSR